LAREAEISYAVVCLVTDYDCWRENGAHVTVSHVLQTLNQNTANAKSLLLAVLPHLERGLKGTGRGAVVKGMNKFAVITAKEKRNDNQVQSLEFLLPGYY
jgi:5'-methylthioadenosine phosphorylase